MTPKSNDAERRLVTYLILITLVLVALPYVYGFTIAHNGGQFIGQAYNIDDGNVYYSWTRQAADGHFFVRNLFTTGPQAPGQFNLFFLLLGLIVRLTGVSIPVLFLIVRLVAGAALLSLLYKFYSFCLPHSAPARVAALGFAALGSGFGWTVWRHWADKSPSGSPIDAWVPEAYTFLSIYFSPLFSASTLLIVGALFCLLLAERTGKVRWAVGAGLCGFVSGNMHSYDVLHIAAAWGLYLVASSVLAKKFEPRIWGYSLLAAVIALPTTAWQFHVFKSDPAFHHRVLVKTLSEHFPAYVLGYGLVFLLAAFAAISMVAKPKGETIALFSERRTALFALCWAVAGFTVIYLPVAFQRKMLMGEDIPLSLLAGVGASVLARHWKPGLQAFGVALLVAAAIPSNLFFLAREFRHLTSGTSETNASPFLGASDIDVFKWLRANTKPSDAVLGFPTLCLYVPGYCDRAVWAGHWSETPDYPQKMRDFSRFASPGLTDSDREAFLASAKTQYLFYPNDVSGFNGRMQDLAASPPPYLVPVYANKDYTIFAIQLPRK